MTGMPLNRSIWLLVACLALIFLGSALILPRTGYGQLNLNFDGIEIDVLHVQGNVYMLVGAGGNITLQVGEEAKAAKERAEAAAKEQEEAEHMDRAWSVLVDELELEEDGSELERTRTLYDQRLAEITRRKLKPVRTAAKAYSASIPAWTPERDLARSWVPNAEGEAGYSPMTLRKNARALPPVILTMSASV